MIRFLRTVWIWTASTLLVLLWVPVLGVIWLLDQDPMRRRTARWFRLLGQWLSKVDSWQVQITGLENLNRDRVYVVISNHQSLTDIPAMCLLGMDAKWLVKSELIGMPVVGWLLRMAGDIPVERSDGRKRAKAMLDAIRCLRQNCSVICFPEGTRAEAGKVLPFNEGLFRVAIREKVAILAVAIEGSAAVLPRDSWMFGESKVIRLRILPVVETEGWTTDQSEQLRDEVRERIVGALSAGASGS